MRKVTLTIFAACALAALTAPPTPTLIDDGWTFTLEGTAPTRVDLPHDWSVAGPYDIDAPANNDGGYLPTGRATYTKTLTLPQAPEQQQYALYFEGAYMDAQVSVNGQKAGGHPYGYTSFVVDITPYVAAGDNLIEVTVDNSRQRNSRWYTGSGIYRHVWLLQSGPLHFAPWGLGVTARDITADSATVEVTVLFANELQDEAEEAIIGIEIIDPEGNLAATAYSNIYLPASETVASRFTIPVVNPQLWSPERPNLYTARLRATSLIADQHYDQAETTFGIRQFEFSADKGLTLNGQPLTLNGACVHHDNGLLGAASYDAAEAWKARQLKEAGFNAVRTSHNVPSPAFLDECDRLGLVVIDEAFDGWRQGKTEHDYSELIGEWWERDLEAMVLRDRNHPSILCWSIGNEVLERKSPDAVATAHKMAQKCRELDPTRPVTSALAAWDADWEIYDPLAAQHDIVGYNYMIHKAEGDHQRVPERVMWQTESYPRDAFANWTKVHDLPYVIGDFVWTGLDYLGEAGIGRHYYEGDPAGEHWERKLWPWHGAYCGDIDLTGLRKPISYYREMLHNPDAASPIYMAVREPDGYRGSIRETLWGTYPTVASWTWPGWEGKPIEVEVYTTQPSVRLYADGRLVGEQQTGRDTEFKATFTLPYQSGTLRAVASDGSETLLQTASEAKAIRLTYNKIHGKNDCRDLIYVVAEVVDAKGRVAPTADCEIEFEVDGHGQIIASGNADMKDMEPYATPCARAWRGRAMAIVLTDANAGDIRVTAKANGLKTGKAMIARR